MRQNWNNLLNYIKFELGANINYIELSDDDIIKITKEHSLVEFSQYSPHIDYIKFDYKNQVENIKPGDNYWTYKIPFDGYIIDINDAYVREGDNVLSDDPYYDTKYSSANFHRSTGLDYYGMIDTAIANKYMDIAKSLSAVNTFNFIAPDLVEFDFEVDHGVLLLGVSHESLNTIRPDMYPTFKKLALGYVQKALSAGRSKFSELSTPFGQIRMDWQTLKSDGERNIQEAIQILDNLPPDKIVHISA